MSLRSSGRRLLTGLFVQVPFAVGAGRFAPVSEARRSVPRAVRIGVTIAFAAMRVLLARSIAVRGAMRARAMHGAVRDHAAPMEPVSRRAVRSAAAPRHGGLREQAQNGGADDGPEEHFVSQFLRQPCFIDGRERAFCQCKRAAMVKSRRGMSVVRRSAG